MRVDFPSPDSPRKTEGRVSEPGVLELGAAPRSGEDVGERTDYHRGEVEAWKR